MVTLFYEEFYKVTIALELKQFFKESKKFKQNNSALIYRNFLFKKVREILFHTWKKLHHFRVVNDQKQLSHSISLNKRHKNVQLIAR